MQVTDDIGRNGTAVAHKIKYDNKYGEHTVAVSLGVLTMQRRKAVHNVGIKYDGIERDFFYDYAEVVGFGDESDDSSSPVSPSQTKKRKVLSAHT